jgi:hypothetical protein
VQGLIRDVWTERIAPERMLALRRAASAQEALPEESSTPDELGLGAPPSIADAPQCLGATTPGVVVPSAPGVVSSSPVTSTAARRTHHGAAAMALDAGASVVALPCPRWSVVATVAQWWSRGVARRRSRGGAAVATGAQPQRRPGGAAAVCLPTTGAFVLRGGPAAQPRRRPGEAPSQWLGGAAAVSATTRTLVLRGGPARRSRGAACSVAKPRRRPGAAPPRWLGGGAAVSATSRTLVLRGGPAWRRRGDGRRQVAPGGSSAAPHTETAGICTLQSIVRDAAAVIAKWLMRRTCNAHPVRVWVTAVILFWTCLLLLFPLSSSFWSSSPSFCIIFGSLSHLVSFWVIVLIVFSSLFSLLYMFCY